MKEREEQRKKENVFSGHYFYLSYIPLSLELATLVIIICADGVGKIIENIIII